MVIKHGNGTHSLMILSPNPPFVEDFRGQPCSIMCMIHLLDMYFFFCRAMIPTYLRGYPTYGIQQAAKKEALVTLVPYEISPFTSI